jgi:hypothetical protein
MSLTQLLILSLIVLFTATALMLLAVAKESQSKNLDPATNPPSRWLRMVTSAAGAAIAVSALLIAICAGLCADSFFRHQALAMRPHTARILSYQVTFPKEIPEGYEGGTITLDYSNDMEGDKQGKQGRTRIAEWSLYHPDRSPIEGGIQFMVNERAQPGVLPEAWQAPCYWRKIDRTLVGTKEVAAIKFDVSRCTAEVYDITDKLNAEKKSSNEPGNEEKFLPTHGAKISALEYLAQEDGKTIGLRGYGYSDENAATLLTESVLNSFHKVKMTPAATAKGKNSTGIGADGTVVIGHTGDADKFVDPYAELIKP